MLIWGELVGVMDGVCGGERCQQASSSLFSVMKLQAKAFFREHDCCPHLWPTVAHLYVSESLSL